MSSVPGGGGFLSALSGLLSTPQGSGLMGLAQGLLASSGASRLPVTMGAALANGLNASQQMQLRAQQVQQAKLQNAMLDLTLPYQAAKTATVIKALNSQNAPPSALEVPAATQVPQVQGAPTAQPQSGLLTSGGITIPGLSGTLMPASKPNQALVQPPVSAIAPMAAAVGAAAAQAAQNQDNQGSQKPIGSRMQATAASQASGNPQVMQELQQDATWRRGFELSLFGIPAGTALMNEAAQAHMQYNPQLQAQIAQKKAQATLPAQTVENMVRYATRPTSLAPGDSAVTGLSVLPQSIQHGLLNVIGAALGPGVAQGGALGTDARAPGAPAAMAPRPALASAGPGAHSPGLPNGMGGTPGGPLVTTASNGLFPAITGQRPYNVALAKDLAADDAKYVGEVRDASAASAQARNNVQEMWQAYQSGLPEGNLSKFQNMIASTFNSLGITPDTHAIDNYTSMQKNATQMGMQLTRTLSSRPSQFEFKYITGAAIPGGHMQHGALGYLLGQMDGVEGYNIARSNYMNARMAKGQNPRAAAASFDTRASATPITWGSLRANDPQYFLTVTDELSKTATGRAMMKQVENEAMWMQKNGLINQNWQLIGGQQ